MSGRPTGRPPTAPELRILEGNPGKRAIGPTGVKPETVPDPPYQLEAHGKAAWDSYWRYGRAWLTLTDIPIITQLCEYHDLREKIMATIRSEGLIRPPASDGKPSTTHRLFDHLRGIDGNIRELWSRCGFTPSDRGRTKQTDPTEDPLEAWERARREGSGG